MASKRIAKELTNMGKFCEENEWCKACGAPGDDANEWEILLEGPAGSPYQGFCFTLNVQFPSDYPLKPPAVSFKSDTVPMHMNVNSDGKICLGLLKDEWKAATKMSAVVTALHSLLECPNPEDPLITDLAELYNKDQEEYNKRCAASAAKNGVKA